MQESKRIIFYHSIMFLHDTLCELVGTLGIERDAIGMVATEENTLPSVVLETSKGALQQKSGGWVVIDPTRWYFDPTCGYLHSMSRGSATHLSKVLRTQ